MRLIFALVAVLVVLVACGDKVPDWKKSSTSRNVAEFNSAISSWEKRNIALRLARDHWSEKERTKWQKTGEELTAKWRDENCVTDFKSEEEQGLLNEISAIRISFNDYESIARKYRSLYDLCGEKSYLEQFSEFESLSEFASKTKSICEEVVHTYRGSAVGEKIQSVYRELTSMDEITAIELGNRAVEGYGNCLCVMHDYFEVRDNFSIGFCVGPNYFTCSHPQLGNAYCGQGADREKLAKIVGDYKYRVPRGSSSYGSYLSPGATAADLLEYGKRKTDELVAEHCAGNPDC
jgi:hypothetical protein